MVSFFFHIYMLNVHKNFPYLQNILSPSISSSPLLSKISHNYRQRLIKYAIHICYDTLEKKTGIWSKVGQA